MPTQFGIQPSFSRGEVSPRLHARVDVDQWRTSLASALNWIVMRHGGLRRRPGTQFAALTKLQGVNNAIRTIPFVYADQSYVLELGNLYMRVLTQGGIVTSGGVPYEIVTPWTGGNLAALQIEQTGDEIYVVHPSYPPHKIRRLEETEWEIVPVPFEDGPYLDVNTTSTRITPSATGHLVPAMTADTDGGYTASASSVYSDGGGPRDAFQAFDFNEASEWMSSGPAPGWLAIELPAAAIVAGYSIKASAAVLTVSELVAPDTYNFTKITGALRAPRTWRFQASTDGSNWITLDTRSAETGWGDGERRFYTFENTVAYQYYRLDIRVSNLQERPVAIAEWSLQGAGADAPTITLTASSTVGINNGKGFLATDVGRHLRFLGQDAFWHWFEITARTNSLNVEAKLRSPPLSSRAGSTSWRLGAFGAGPGYPRGISFFLGRLCYGGTKERPLGIYGSVVNDFDSFTQSIPLKADEAFSFTVGVGGEVSWLLDGGDVLIVGTGTALRSLGPANKNEPFSAVNIQQGKPAYVGAIGSIQPVKVGQTPVFAGRFGNNLREATYSFDAQGFVAPDISVWSEHLFHSRVLRLAYAQEPNSTIWCQTADGRLVAVTYEREQQMTAFTPQQLGGSGVVESLCVIPGPDRHEVWLVVRRQRPNGTYMRTHERVAKDFEDAPMSNAYFVDCGLTYSGVPALGLTGADHLIGWSAAMAADGAEQEHITVTGADVSIPDGAPASTIHLGLPYESRAKTLRIAQGMGDGSGLGRKKRVKGVMLDVMETGQARVQASASRSEEVVLRNGSETMDNAPPLVTDKVGPIHIDDRWEGQGVVEIICDSTRPATIRAITVVADGEP